MTRAAEFQWIASVGIGRYVMAMGVNFPMQFTTDQNLALRLSTIGRTQMANSSPPGVTLTFHKAPASGDQ